MTNAPAPAGEDILAGKGIAYFRLDRGAGLGDIMMVLGPSNRGVSMPVPKHSGRFRPGDFEPRIPTHDSRCLSRLLKYLGGHPESLKSLRIQHNLKRLTSAVQVRPWPPHFKALSQILSVIPVRSQSAFLYTPKTVAVAASC